MANHAPCVARLVSGGMFGTFGSFRFTTGCCIAIPHWSLAWFHISDTQKNTFFKGRAANPLAFPCPKLDSLVSWSFLVCLSKKWRKTHEFRSSVPDMLCSFGLQSRTWCTGRIWVASPMVNHETYGSGWLVISNQNRHTEDTANARMGITYFQRGRSFSHEKIILYGGSKWSNAVMKWSLV